MTVPNPPAERPFWNPYVAGVVLGLVLLTTFLVMGFGLGSSGGVTRLAAAAVDLVAPTAVETNGYFSQYFGPGKHVLWDWLVFEILGVFLGGALGAYSAGRMRLGVDKGPRATNGQRLAFAFAGGILMGFAARLARGCTSGQALTGGAALSLGSWVFMMAVFTGGFLVAPFVRRQWR
ncbi:MAG TPA: YeeE/YedE thiosulfate transporter family protein [Thermoanaerobaculia bacterium]|nr:YeeE/YedE thiosulfate transporter family protein [Thermoanaerobaculia bacterium]